MLSLIGSAIVGGVITLVIAFVFASSDAFQDLSSKSITAGTNGETAAIEPRVGACFRGEVDDIAGKITAIESEVSCSATHKLEAFATTEVPLNVDANYDAQTLSYFASGFCELSYEPYVGTGYMDSEYDYGSVIPSRDAWEAGERGVSCFGFALFESLDQSLQGIER